MSIEIANESGVPVDEGRVVSVARYTLERMNVSPRVELSVVLVELDAMSDLHRQWMDSDGPTDVLAFPMDELETGARPDAPEPAPALLGDIVLCPEYAGRAARQEGHGTDDELALLTVHGVLHLLGYDHGDRAEEREMFGLQRRILADFGAAVAEAHRRQAERSADGRLLGAVGLDSEDPE
jgi:probable rRNA maturation factor